MSEAMMRDFEQHRPALVEACSGLRARFESLVRDAAVPVSFVSARVKESSSLAHKLARPDKSYRTLWEVTDLVGVRVSVSFEDHLEPVSRLIERHFEVDYSNSLERVRPAGYRSVHYVCRFRNGPHDDFRFEVQVRSVLQHAWAELEHDLGYKANDAVPEAVRRRFTRVASLLEIADQEFVAIRRELEVSREAAKSAVTRGDGDVPLDLVSLEAVVRHPAVEGLDQAIATAFGRPLADAAFFPDYLVEVLRLCGLSGTRAVVLAAERLAGEVLKVLPRYSDFARAELGFDTATLSEVERGYGLLFVAHLAVIRGSELGVAKVSRLTKLYHQLEFPNDERAAHRVASAVISALG